MLRRIFLTLRQSDPDDASDTESEFEADPEDLVSEESEDDVSDYDASDASDNDGSASDFGGDESDEGSICPISRCMLIFTAALIGDDWDELERKAAKCDYHFLGFSACSNTIVS
jgi:hypothetical protein